MNRAFRVLLLASTVAAPASASFHLMQIEQAIGGVCGDPAQQAIQLRLRSGGQNVVNQARLFARDAAGANPVLLLNFPSNVSSGSAGARVLVSTAAFNAANGVTPDFVPTASIPASYLAAGRLTFEDDFGNILWSLSWGGAAYTGSTTGTLDNDADGNFGPSFAGPLTADSVHALRFGGSAAAQSTTNAVDYAVTSGAAVVTNNAGAAEIVAPACFLFEDGFESGDTSAWSGVAP